MKSVVAANMMRRRPADPRHGAGRATRWSSRLPAPPGPACDSSTPADPAEAQARRCAGGGHVGGRLGTGDAARRAGRHGAVRAARAPARPAACASTATRATGAPPRTASSCPISIASSSNRPGAERGDPAPDVRRNRPHAQRAARRGLRPVRRAEEDGKVKLVELGVATMPMRSGSA